MTVSFPDACSCTAGELLLERTGGEHDASPLPPSKINSREVGNKTVSVIQSLLVHLHHNWKSFLGRKQVSYLFPVHLKCILVCGLYCKQLSCKLLGFFELVEQQVMRYQKLQTKKKYIVFRKPSRQRQIQTLLLKPYNELGGYMPSVWRIVSAKVWSNT